MASNRQQHKQVDFYNPTRRYTYPPHPQDADNMLPQRHAIDTQPYQNNKFVKEYMYKPFDPMKAKARNPCAMPESPAGVDNKGDKLGENEINYPLNIPGTYYNPEYNQAVQASLKKIQECTTAQASSKPKNVPNKNGLPMKLLCAEHAKHGNAKIILNRAALHEELNKMPGLYHIYNPNTLLSSYYCQERDGPNTISPAPGLGFLSKPFRVKNTTGFKSKKLQKKANLKRVRSVPMCCPPIPTDYSTNPCAMHMRLLNGQKLREQLRTQPNYREQLDPYEVVPICDYDELYKKLVGYFEVVPNKPSLLDMYCRCCQKVGVEVPELGRTPDGSDGRRGGKTTDRGGGAEGEDDTDVRKGEDVGKDKDKDKDKDKGKVADEADEKQKTKKGKDKMRDSLEEIDKRKKKDTEKGRKSESQRKNKEKDKKTKREKDEEAKGSKSPTGFQEKQRGKKETTEKEKPEKPLREFEPDETTDDKKIDKTKITKETVEDDDYKSNIKPGRSTSLLKVRKSRSGVDTSEGQYETGEEEATDKSQLRKRLWELFGEEEQEEVVPTPAKKKRKSGMKRVSITIKKPDCPCPLCESMKCNEIGEMPPWMQQMIAEREKRELMDYYRSMKRKECNIVEPKPCAPQHKVDMILFNNDFCNDAALIEAAECQQGLKLLQELLATEKQKKRNELPEYLNCLEIDMRRLRRKLGMC